VEGAVVRFEFMNPHSWIYLDVVRVIMTGSWRTTRILSCAIESRTPGTERVPWASPVRDVNKMRNQPNAKIVFIATP